MNLEPKPGADASISELMTQLTSQTSRLVRDEMRLAQKEFVTSAEHAGIGARLSVRPVGGSARAGSVVAAAIAGTVARDTGVGGRPDDRRERQTNIHELKGAGHDH